MGKEYWYWGSATKSSKKPPPASASALEKPDQPPSPGCISAVFHLFDFHHLHLPNFNHQPTCNANTLTHVSLLPQQPSRPKGGEAPRDSLESLDESSASLPATSKEEENLKIPAMGMRVKIKGSVKTISRAKSVDALNNSDADSSPAAKTPNLVARLMGLDIIPDNDSISSPSPSCRAKPRLDPRRPTKNHTTTRRRNSVDGSDIAGIRSLPQTPRISASRRSDVDYHHRLSLQLNKENCLSINEDENRSPGLYARQRVKQIKESVSRKVGIDITNTVKSRGQQQRKDEVIGGHFKSNRLSNKSAREESAVPTPSLRPRIAEPKKYQNSFEVINPQNLRSFEDSSTLGKKTRNDTAAKFDIRLRKPQQATDIIRNKQGEPFVRSPAGNRGGAYDRKCKKTPLSPHLLHISVPNLPHVKKDPCPPETKITQKKEPSEAQKPKPKPNCGSPRLPCTSSQGNKKEEATHAHRAEDGDSRYGCGASVATTADESAERDYITNLLRRTGIDGDTVVSSATGFSPSHPLDPSVFYCIEDLGIATKTTNFGRMRHLSNRKLLFDLVDMMLAEFSKPVGRSCGSTRRQALMSGTQLVETLVSNLRTFPQADCRVLEDIDSLVEIDLQTEKVNASMAVEEESEAIVTAVEEEILERLVEETAAEICRALKRHRFTRSLARSRDHMRHEML